MFLDPRTIPDPAGLRCLGADLRNVLDTCSDCLAPLGSADADL